MLESVTLAEMIELMVQVLVDLATSAIFDQETAEDTEASHPENLAVFNGQHSILAQQVVRLLIVPLQ